jgi:hypothetical protein
MYDIKDIDFQNAKEMEIAELDPNLVARIGDEKPRA